MRKDWIWTDHIKRQMHERKIGENMVNSALSKPDNIVPSSSYRSIYQKLEFGKLIRVVTEGEKLITVYTTDKIDKYFKRSIIDYVDW